MSEVWPFIPEGLSVQLGWLTSVVSTFTTEQRAELRQKYPRAKFKITSLIKDDETFLARRIAERAEGEFIVPDWRFASFASGLFDQNNLTISVDDNYFYSEVGDQALVWKSPTKFYLLTIDSRGVDSLTATSGPVESFENFYVMPVHPAYSRGGIRFKHGTNNVNDVTIDLETHTYKDLTSFSTSYPTFQGFEVNTDRDIFVGQHDAEILKAVNIIDGQTGVVVLEEIYNHVDLNTTLSAHDKGGIKMISREGWLHKRRGKLVPFWKSSWGSDLILQTSALAGTTQLTADLAAPAIDYVGRRFIVDQGGSFQFFEVIGATDNNTGYGASYGASYGAASSGDTLIITISPALSEDIDLSKLLTISEMNLTRLDADEIEFRYTPGIIGTINVPLAGLDNDL